MLKQNGFKKAVLQVSMEMGRVCQKYQVSKLLVIFVGSLILLGQKAFDTAAATLNVTNYGAIGDCANITVSVTSNSRLVVTTNLFSGTDVGKVMCLFGAGRKSALSSTGIFQGNYQGTPTNNQDMVVTILSIANGTNVTISSPCGITANSILCTYGTQNKSAFDNCIAAAPNPCTIYIPTGNYLLVPPTALNTNYLQTGQWDCAPTITIQKGGLHFLGDGTNKTILTGNGAWQQKSYDSAYRGYLFRILGPITNDGPFIFDNIQFNGNAARKHGGYFGYPAIPTDGSGWDPTHHAIVEDGTAPGHAYKSYTNCLFTRWHGETLQGLFTGDGFLDVGHCSFIDGTATVFNSSLPHDYHHNLIADYYQVEEFYQAYAKNLSTFRSNFVTNIYGAGIAINGADTNQPMAAYNITSNTFYLGSRNGIYTTPAQNISIVGNQFYDGSIAINLGSAGYQGTAINSNFFIAFNTFTNNQVPILLGGAGQNRVSTVLVVSNYANITEAFAEATGWSTNVSFLHNTSNKGLDSTTATGQWIIDDASNNYPAHSYNDFVGGINAISYARGGQALINNTMANSVFAMDDAHPQQIPPGAVLMVTNSANRPAPLYFSATMSGTPQVLSKGDSVTCLWTNGAWRSIDRPFPPQGVRLLP